MVCGSTVVLAGGISAQVTQRVTLDSNGVEADESSFHPSISAGGRYVAFHSRATNLVAGGDPNLVSDVFVRDRQTGATVKASVDGGGASGNHNSEGASISADGRFVLFKSAATNLVPGDTNGVVDVFLRDLQSMTTERVSVDSSEAQANGDCWEPAISGDGRFATFSSFATTLVAGDTNGAMDVFVRDLLNGTTERVSVSSVGMQANNHSTNPSISPDGRYVVFESYSSNLVPADANVRQDVFIRDRVNGTTERFSVDSSGAEGDEDSRNASVSADGRYVAFESDATNLVAGDTNLFSDVFVRDLQDGTTARASVGAGGSQVHDRSVDPSISSDGRHVAFWSYAYGLAPGDINTSWDVFLRDMQTGTNELMSVGPIGAPGNDNSTLAAMTPDGRFVAFESVATNLVPDDTNLVMDVFLRDRAHAGYANLCEPGVAGVIGCPCSNPPSGPGRGCDNSSATGGARLEVSGGEFLSSDSLVFAATGERPSPLSLVLQGTSVIPAGVIYGQGVRCVGGSLKRLYTKNASSGSITAPDFGAGEQQAHARSAALGDVIAAGSSRWYMVFYRDPIVLSGCPAASTFNGTQTREVSWRP